MQKRSVTLHIYLTRICFTESSLDLQMKFFGTENAEESPSEVSTDGIAEALAPLLGMTAAEVKAGQTIMRSPVFTAGLIAFDKEGQRRWFLAETTLRTSENEVR